MLKLAKLNENLYFTNRECLEIAAVLKQSNIDLFYFVQYYLKLYNILPTDIKPVIILEYLFKKHKNISF